MTEEKHTQGKPFECPGKDLDSLIRVLNQLRFCLAFERPEKAKIEARVKGEYGPALCDPDLLQLADQDYQNEMQRYSQYKKVREKFVQYFEISPEGMDVEELEESRVRAHGILRRHIEKCKSCRNGYLNLKDGFLTREGKINAQIFRENGRRYGFREIRELDKMYLGLLGFEEE